MKWFFIAAIVIIVAALFYVIKTFNNFVQLKNRIEEAFSTMDVYLKKRWDMIPNLVEIVKGYAKHESETLEEVVRLRNCAYDTLTTEDKLDVNNKLLQGINKIMAISESYPDLKANESFNELSEQLSQAEKDIANARKYYNATVRNMNDKVEMFPSNIIANMFGFKTQKMFEVNEKERENVQISF